MLTVNAIRYVNSVFQPKLANVIGLCSSQCGVSVNQAPFSKIHVPKNCTDKNTLLNKILPESKAVLMVSITLVICRLSIFYEKKKKQLLIVNSIYFMK